MEIDEYLRFVATKVKEASGKENLSEIVRLLKVCSETILEKANEIDEGGG